MPRMTITHQGERLLIKEAAARAGITGAALRGRLTNGWTVEEALAAPVSSHGSKNSVKRVLFRGQMMTVREIADLQGVDAGAVYNRIARGKELDKPFRSWNDNKPLPPLRIKPPKAKHPRRRSPTEYTFAGRTLTLSEWGKLLGIKRDTLWERMNAFGWTLEKTLTTPLKSKVSFGSKAKQTGGNVQTSKEGQGTGVGSVPHDLHGDQP